MVPNPMYANIGMQPGFQGTQGQFGMSQGTLGMAGFSIPPVKMTPGHRFVIDQGVQMAPTCVPIMQTVSYDNLESMDKPKSYEEGGQSVQFDTLSGFDERTKAFSFLEQFDKVFVGRNFTEASKVGKAATFLKGNASQWWNTLLLQGQAPSTWIDFIQVFDSTWLTNDFEADVMLYWHNLHTSKCKDLEDYMLSQVIRLQTENTMLLTLLRHQEQIESLAKENAALKQALAEVSLKPKASCDQAEHIRQDKQDNSGAKCFECRREAKTRKGRIPKFGPLISSCDG
ncbi:hypothetical protein L7F22_046159 [Adiantum nelumboides]|nr:hypothetical protein [Adiantum nelumboides]